MKRRGRPGAPRPAKMKARGRAVRAAIATAGTGAPTMRPHDLTFFRTYFVVVVATLCNTDVERPDWRVEGSELVKLKAACPLCTSCATTEPLLVITPADAVLLIVYNERAHTLCHRKVVVDRKRGVVPSSATLVPALLALPNQITPTGSHFARRKSIAVGAGHHAIQSFYHTKEYYKCCYAPYPARNALEQVHRTTVSHEARKWEERVDSMLNGFLSKYVGAYRV